MNVTTPTVAATDSNLLPTLLGTSTGASILALVVAFLRNINHRRLRSSCCGVPIIMSVDVENTTPPQEHNFQVNNPMPQVSVQS
jgi:hypothetical protein